MRAMNASLRERPRCGEATGDGEDMACERNAQGSDRV